MREIKFRAWDKNGGDMFYNVQNGIEFSDLSHYTFYDFLGNKALVGDCHDWEIQQFTGLKDKNGKDIYEGDIYHQGDKNILYKVIFNDCYFIGNQIGNESLAGLSHFIKDIEVIGNVFENPELY